VAKAAKAKTNDKRWQNAIDKACAGVVSGWWIVTELHDGVSIPCAEGVVTREATGCEDADAKGYGDSSSNAEAMALKRAASKFGLGLYLYQK
jgi:hypothetical protein